MITTRAADDLVCLAFVNMVGGRDELVFDGGSLIVNERGEPRGPRPSVRRGLRRRRSRPRRRLPTRGCTTRGAARRSCGRRVRVTRVTLSAPSEMAAPPLAPRALVPLPPVDEVYEALVLGTRDYVRKNGFKHVVIGLSGGIDSSLVAAIAVEALGKENVSGVTMPSPYSSTGTRGDAKRLARNLGIDFQTLPITPVFKGVQADAGRAVQGRQGGRGRGEHPGPHPRHTCSWRSATSSAGWC